MHEACSAAVMEGEKEKGRSGRKKGAKLDKR